MNGWVVSAWHGLPVFLSGKRQFHDFKVPCNVSYWRVPAPNDWDAEW